MAKGVTIVDYGVGNLRSVARAFEHVGAEVDIACDAKAIARAQRLVLPGVGAFGHCMEELEKRGLIAPIKEFAQSGRPFLGICVGMQIMLEYGEEFGEHEGLGLIPGKVQKLSSLAKRGDPGWIASSPASASSFSAASRNDDMKMILPVIGWMPLANSGKGWERTVLSDIKEGSHVYFVHSFCANPGNADVRIASYEYGGVAVTAAIAKDNLTGLQFHPEKSGEVGLSVLRKFI